MSDATPNNASVCEQLLDYVYGELDEAGKRAFEEHLPGCARCQAEVASFGRVRAATRRVLPTVEPPASIGSGALHAQLMHAAAQRVPKRGVLLAFPRKILAHPAWAAAAMFVIVGGAIAVNWSHGKLEMPAADKAAAPTGDTTTAAAPAAPAAEPVPAEKNKEEEAPQEVPLAKTRAGALAADSVKDTKLALEMPPAGTLTVERPAKHSAAPARTAPAKKMTSIAGKKAAFDDLASDDDGVEGGAAGAGKGGAVHGEVRGGVVGGVVGGSIGGVAAPRGNGVASTGRVATRDDRDGAGDGYGSRGAPVNESAAKSSAPATRTAKAEAKPKAAPPASMQQGWYANQPPPPPVAAAPAPIPAAESTPVQRREVAQSESYRARPELQNAQAVQKPAGPSRYLEDLRKRADEWARSGRCEEAIKAYQQLDKQSQYISVRERANYVHCLTAVGRQQEAEQALDELKADKRVTNAEVQKVEEEVAKQRHAASDRKAKKPAAPADRAAQREKAADAPAPAAPPPPAQKQQQKQAPSSAY